MSTEIGTANISCSYSYKSKQLLKKMLKISKGDDKGYKDDNFEILVNKVDSLEKELLSEKVKSRNYEEELNILKTYKIPLLYRTIEEKDNYIDSILVEQIKLQKEIKYLKDNFEGDNLKKLIISKYIIPEYQEEKDKLIIYQTNKIDYLNDAYKRVKTFLKEKEEDYQKQINELNNQIRTQEEQISILKDIKNKNDKKILELNEEINDLAEINKNSTLQISTLNDIITEINNEKEKYMLQNEYHKKENEFISNNNNLILSRIQKQDEDYKKINDLLEEYKEKLSEIDTKTYIFKVTSIGKIVESAAEIVFNKEGRNKYVINIKYITSSYKYDILDIEEISQMEGEENIFIIKYNKNKERDDEMFRTHELNKILKIFQDFRSKAIQFSDIKKIKREERKKEKRIKKNVNAMFDIW